MGIRGLSSYVNACQRSCAEHIELGFTDDDDESRQGQAGGAVQRLAVDGLALVYHVMGNSKDRRLHLELGCDYEALAAALLDYLLGLRNARITPVVIVDGMQDTEKAATTLLRRRAQVEEASMLMEHIGENGVGECTGSGAGSIFPSAVNRLSLLPLFAAETLAAACHTAGVAFRVADREADPELAAACRSYSRPPDKKGDEGTRATPEGRGSGVGDDHWVGGCDAVLSNDSDFLVMDIPGYIPLWALGLGGDGSAGALVFRRPKLAARLGIPADRLPDLACLIGNDWIQPDDRVHGIIMRDRAGTVPIGNSNNQNTRHGEPKKRRKGTSGGGTRSGTKSSAPPAKDLVEATARFLARFYHQQRLHQADETEVEATGKLGNISRTRGGKDSVLGECENSAKLHLHQSNRREPHPQARETTEHARHARTPSREAVGDEGEKDRENDPLDASLCRRFFAHRPSSGDGDDVDTIEHAAGGVATTTTAGDRPAAVQCKKSAKRSGKGKGKKIKRGTSRYVLMTSSVGKAASLKRVGDEEERGNGWGGGRRDEHGADLGGGEAFLQNFRAAKRHFEIAVTLASRCRAECSGGKGQRRGNAGGCSAVVAEAGGISSARGLPTGLSAPPELVQAVLEGVFWCRVLLEDAPVRKDKLHPTTRSRPHSQRCQDSSMSQIAQEPSLPEDNSCTRKPTNADASTEQGTGQEQLASRLAGSSRTPFDAPFLGSSDDGRPPAHEDMLSRRDGSAFGSFSEMRRRLYELCLALRPDLAEYPIVVGAPSPSMDQDFSLQQKREILENRGQGRTDETQCSKEEADGTLSVLKCCAILRQGGHVQGNYGDSSGSESEGGGEGGMGGVGAGVRGWGTVEDDDDQGVSKEGKRWVVNEMRRVGSSVKAVAVLCQVPPPLMLPPVALNVSSGGYVDMTRWKVFLSVLGLGDRDNQQLTALVMAEAEKFCVGDAARAATQGRVGQSQNENRGEGRHRHSLAGVAVVAALLLSTSSSPVIAAPHSSNSNDGVRLMCCSNEIALAFIVAATRCAHPPYHFPTGRVNPSSASGGGSDKATPREKAMMSTCTADCCGCVCPSRTDGLDQPGTNGDSGTASARPGRVSKDGGVRYGGGRRHAEGKLGAGEAPLLGVGSGISRRRDTPETDTMGDTVCRACLGKGNDEKKTTVNDVTEADGYVDRRFVSLWSHVQAAVWHTNACHSILGLNLKNPTIGSGNEGERRGVAVDPLLLRPALALQYYRGRRRCLQRSRQNQGDSNGHEARERERQAALHVANIELEQQEHATRPHSSQITLTPGKQRSGSKQQEQLKGRGGSLCAGKDKGSSGQEIRGCQVLASSKQQQGWQQRDLGCVARPPPELAAEEVVCWGVVQGCRGTCAWAQRVRTVMAAAGVVYY